VALVDPIDWDRLLGIGSATSITSAGSGLPRPVVTLDVDAQAQLGGRFVVVLLAGLLFLWGDACIGEHQEGMAGRHQPDRVVALLERAAFGCGRLLERQLGQWVDLQPLVGDWLAAPTDRP
jgi:hypothetical protein